ncbi:MAG: acetylxylan esterase [Prevotella sp.]
MNGKTLLFLLIIASSATPGVAQNTKPGREYVEQFVTTDHADRSYRVGERARLLVSVLTGGKPPRDVKVIAEYGDDMMAADGRDTVWVRDGHADIDIGTRGEPGFRFCNYRFTANNRNYRGSLKVAFSPEAIIPYTTMPKDFRKFWKKQLDEAAKTPLKAVVTPLPQYSNDTVRVSLVCLSVGPGSRNVYGYLSEPNDTLRHPVLFSPPGAGNGKRKPDLYYAAQGYICMNINIHYGHNSELTDSAYNEVKRLTEEYWTRGWENRETCYYRDVYTACSRCVDWLCTLSRWDGVNVGVTGGSQGGALAVVTAALNDKVTFCSAFYPALCDMTGFLHGRAGGWPRFFDKYKLAGTERQKAVGTMQYYDVVNFGRSLHCPLFLSYGYADNTCPPTSVAALENSVTVPLTVEITPSSAHWRYDESNEKSTRWMREQWR